MIFYIMRSDQPATGSISLMTKANSDAFAAILSSLCLVHCLAVPVVLVMLPSMTAGASGLWPALPLLDSDLLHWLMLLLAAPFSLHAMLGGRAVHHEAGPMRLALAGLAVMALGALLHDYGLVEKLLTVGGGLVVAAAHWWNWRVRGRVLRG